MALLIVVASAGCSAYSSFSDGPYEVVEGRYFDARLIFRIEDGQTTADEILEWFGEPIERASAEAGETWRYRVVRERKGIEDPILGAKKVYLQTLEESLVVQLSDGRVVSHRHESDTDERVVEP